VTLSVFSFGGGVQSTAALVLAARGELDCRTFLFSDVGDDSENPATVAYVRDFAEPFAAEHGLEFVRLTGSRSLYAKLTAPGSRSVGIPVRMAGGAPVRRQCTVDFKIRRVGRELKRRGATAEEPATVMLGISMDEWHRARTPDASGIAWTRLAYPLIDRRLYRDHCLRIVQEAGLPEPPKSACWFCPLHSLPMWREQARRQPDLFARSVELEASLNRRRAELGKDAVFFTSRLRPLPMAVQDDGQLDLDGLGCDSGYCFT
jgi:hypothetical protein